MKVLILGAGLAGASTAYMLTRAGFEVTVLDRQESAAQETSFANGGQISAASAVPWASIDTLLDVMRHLGRSNGPFRIHPTKAGADFWRWGLKFLRECPPARLDSNRLAMSKLALFSRAALLETLKRENIDCAQRSSGILQIFTTRKSFQKALSAIEDTPEARVLSAREAIDTEPALDTHAGSRLYGAVLNPHDIAGNAATFTREILDRAVQKGGTFRGNCTVRRLITDTGRVTGVELSETNEHIEADAVVLCLGVDDRRVARTAGIDLPIYPVRGYSVEYPVAKGNGPPAPSMSLTHLAARLVVSPIGNIVRVAGMADFAGYDRTVPAARIDTLTRQLASLLPQLPPEAATQAWAGLRPKTPDSLPHIGQTAAPGLWANTGHGYLGWTWACGSAQLLADLMSGGPTSVDPAPYRPGR